MLLPFYIMWSSPWRDVYRRRADRSNREACGGDRGAAGGAGREIAGASGTASVRFADPASLHLTLAFLGELDEARLPEAIAATEDVALATSPFALSVAGIGTFGGAKAPRVIWAGVVGDIAALLAVQSHLARALEARGFVLEARRSAASDAGAAQESPGRGGLAPAGGVGTRRADRRGDHLTGGGAFGDEERAAARRRAVHAAARGPARWPAHSH